MANLKVSCFAATILAVGTLFADEPSTVGHWWSEPTSQALERAADNRPELLHALETVPATQREGIQFLLENMPERDLRVLSGGFLLANVAGAYDAWEHAPWSKSVPKEIFLNEILPYANASETREPWRAEMRARCLPLVEGCTSPAEAAQRLNETLFPLVNVHYSTGRAKADQSPAESMASGLASCTGLSILLVDACRSVGVPARLAGIPDWTDGRGNHTWVEVWDAGTWHFLGAAEPDKRGLDHAWFERDAAAAQKDTPRHAIHAVSFRRTGLAFPIAWGPDTGGVDAENVTDRYTHMADGTLADPLAPAAASTTRWMLSVREGPPGKRIAANVRVNGITEPSFVRTGVTKDEGNDTNDVLSFDLPREQDFEWTVEHDGEHASGRFHTGTEDGPIEELVLPTPRRVHGPEDVLRRKVEDYFAAPAAGQAAWKFDPSLDALLERDPAGTRRAIWDAYCRAPVHAERRADFAAKRVRSGEYVSPYTLRTVGDKPAAGWGLVIAMHGGGGAPKEVNDSQWLIMQTYYRDHPESGGYLYLALRAPNDTWNGFYDDYVYPLVDNLIRQVAVNVDLDPDRVYLIGYSHGGYGAFAIGPKMPDHFAAIHSSAAAPTDGLISLKTLRNTPFDFAVGEFDTAYGRRERCEVFSRAIQELKGNRADVFPVTFSLITGRHHSDLSDHEQLREMVSLRRQPVPPELTWEQTDGVVRHFYWLTDRAPGKGHEIDAACRNNRLTITNHHDVTRFSVWLDERTVDFHRPLTVEHDGQTEEVAIHPSIAALCRSLLERGDAGLAFICRLDFEAAPDGKLRPVAATQD